MKTSILSSILIAFLLGTFNLEAQRSNATNSTSRRQSTSGTSSTTQNQSGTSRSASRHAVDQRAQSSSSNQSVANSHQGDQSNRQTVVVKKNKPAKHYPQHEAVVVTHRPDRSFNEINHDHQRINYRGYDYAYSKGHYYKRVNEVYNLVPPPHGIRVKIIPSDFLTIMVQSVPYYFYEGVYYRNTNDDDYEVVAPPMGAIVPELPEYDVKALVIDGKTVFEYDNILYKPVVTKSGVQYKVIGTIGD